MTRWMAAVLTACVVAGSVTSCSDGSAVPEGFQKASTERVEVAFPRGWQRTRDAGAALAAQAQDASGVTARLAVLHRVGSASTPELPLAMAQSAVQLSPGFRISRQRGVRVPGARSALRCDYAYQVTERPRQPARPIQAVDVALVDADRTAVVVRVSWHNGRMDTGTVQRIVDSIRMRRP